MSSPFSLPISTIVNQFDYLKEEPINIAVNTHISFKEAIKYVRQDDYLKLAEMYQSSDVMRPIILQAFAKIINHYKIKLRVSDNQIPYADRLLMRINNKATLQDDQIDGAINGSRNCIQHDKDDRRSWIINYMIYICANLAQSNEQQLSFDCFSASFMRHYLKDELSEEQLDNIVVENYHLGKFIINELT